MQDVDVGYAVHLSGLALPAGVTIIALTHGEDHDIPVVSVNARRGGAEQDDSETEGADSAADESSDEAVGRALAYIWSEEGPQAKALSATGRKEATEAKLDDPAMQALENHGLQEGNC